jgi:hypothetical protein
MLDCVLSGEPKYRLPLHKKIQASPSQKWNEKFQKKNRSGMRKKAG